MSEEPTGRPPLPTAALLAAELGRLGRADALVALQPPPAPAPPRLLSWGSTTLPLDGRTLVMGVINVTDDSLSGDGLGDDLDAVLARAEALVAAGADILDVGGESTRPGAPPVSADQERARVEPAVALLAHRLAVPLSVDTRRASVAEAALAAGAGAINDVSGLRHDPALAAVAARAGATLVLGHWAAAPARVDPVAAVVEELRWSVERALAAGVPRERLAVDPGLGFGKAPRLSLALLRRLDELQSLGLPIVVGPSRKGFIGRVLGPEAQMGWEGTAAAVALAIAGGAAIVRVHDVAPLARVVRMADAITSTQYSVLVYLGLGSNLGERERNLAAAVAGLEAAGVAVRRRSPLYESAPVGPPDQPWYLNAVVEAETRLAPPALLAAAKSVERAVGRRPGPRWGPRVVDVDILLYGNEQVAEREPWLAIPHPELWQRLFVLAPLGDLRPDLRGPDGRPIGAWIAELASEQAIRPADTSW